MFKKHLVDFNSMPLPEFAVTIEIGHKAAVRNQQTAEGFTHEWEVFIQGKNGLKLETFVKKVVFLLHPSFSNPKRVCTQPPYAVHEHGFGGFILYIDIYFKAGGPKEPTRLDYDLFLQSLGSPPISHLQEEKITFNRTSKTFMQKLDQGFAEPSKQQLLNTIYGKKLRKRAKKEICSPESGYLSTSIREISNDKKQMPTQLLEVEEPIFSKSDTKNDNNRESDQDQGGSFHCSQLKFQTRNQPQMNLSAQQILGIDDISLSESESDYNTRSNLQKDSSFHFSLLKFQPGILSTKKLTPLQLLGIDELSSSDSDEDENQNNSESLRASSPYLHRNNTISKMNYEYRVVRNDIKRNKIVIKKTCQ